MSKTAVGYARLSQEGKSIPEQIDAIAEHCVDNSLNEVYNDGEGASGYADEREEYQKLLKHLRDDDRAVEHVVVRGLSRLFRDRLHRMRLLIELRREDVDVHAVNRGSRNPVDLSEPGPERTDERAWVGIAHTPFECACWIMSPCLTSGPLLSHVILKSQDDYVLTRLVFDVDISESR